MSFESDRFPGETHLYAPSLDDRAGYRPSRQIFWGEHVPWLPDGWGLPRHVKSSDSEVVAS